MSFLRKIKGGYYLYFSDPTRTPTQKSYPIGKVKASKARAIQADLDAKYRTKTFDPWNHRPDATDAPLTLRDAIDAFFAERQDLRATTETNYRKTLLPFLHTTPPGCRLDEVSTKHLRPFIYQRGRKPATHATRHRILKLFFNYAVREQWLDRSPLAHVKSPSLPKPSPHFLSREDFERLLGAMTAAGATWLSRVTRFAVATGLRRGELCALRWEDVDLSPTHPTLTLRNDSRFRTKSGQDHRLPLVRDALAVLAEIRPKTEGVVLRSAKGNAINADYLTKRFKHFLGVAGLRPELRLHSLRHTCASWLAQSGESLFLISTVLAHSSTKPTEIYAHMDSETLRASMERGLGRDLRASLEGAVPLSRRAVAKRRRTSLHGVTRRKSGVTRRHTSSNVATRQSSPDASIAPPKRPNEGS